MAFLKVVKIHKQGEDSGVLKEISFTQRKLQKIAIAGETGSGKSSLLKIIAGLLQPDSGQVVFNNERIEGPEEKLVPGHSEIAYLSQHFELPKFLSVEQVLSYSNTLAEAEAERIYKVCQITHLLERKTDQLSGGERQRIALARLLTSGPLLLLLDEPFSNLDMGHKNILKNVISEISKEFSITCILISHDPADMLSWADEILVLREGKVVQKGTPKEIYNTPTNEYVAGLFGKYNIVSSNTFRDFEEKGRDYKERRNSSNTKNPLLIRPEQFIIVEEGSNGIRGIVKEVSFFGNYYEVEVIVLGESIVVRTQIGNLKKGEKVYVAPSQNIN